MNKIITGHLLNVKDKGLVTDSPTNDAACSGVNGVLDGLPDTGPSVLKISKNKIISFLLAIK